METHKHILNADEIREKLRKIDPVLPRPIMGGLRVDPTISRIAKLEQRVKKLEQKCDELTDFCSGMELTK